MAKRWECSESHVRKLIRRGELPHFRLGGKLLRIRTFDVEEFEARLTPSADQEPVPVVTRPRAKRLDTR
ncbi:MAG: helix-turn-helix domain-containing protein [Mesorhizobium sp.]|nr:MAG: helix-turn-helix domain-containing protein [Mesorhizobium sp.]TIL86674.1 MAG: helix-turn-helix domain-containing protein [Mesorhizobium sp.]TIL98414.1 MAG: helix-turn-helix domain-containing protein [Mesorhizobium sp.]TIM34049.1 MAG: helix-turn-helix domain-containing protein [Mesorhizobium sp.]TIM80875.1 MAG: helix-turn-helix domain-containing protein [Mesorhizobium sp.]